MLNEKWCHPIKPKIKWGYWLIRLVSHCLHWSVCSMEQQPLLNIKGIDINLVYFNVCFSHLQFDSTWDQSVNKSCVYTLRAAIESHTESPFYSNNISNSHFAHHSVETVARLKSGSKSLFVPHFLHHISLTIGAIGLALLRLYFSI